MIIYTEMRAAHVAQVAALEAACFAAPWSLRSIETELDNPLALWLVALDGERVVGYVGSQTAAGETDMMNIAVAPEYRRNGVARSLIMSLIQALRDRGSVSLSLEVRESNAPAIALYEALGFREVGCRRNYYRNPREDALILRKEWEL